MKISSFKPLSIQISATANSYIEQALQSLRQNDRLDCGSYGRLIHFFTNNQLLRLAKQLHARLFLFSVTPDNFLASNLITFYSKSHQLPQAHHVFDQIIRKNTFSWNAMLIGYSLNDMHFDTVKLFSSMVSSYSIDMKPDNYTVSCVVKALAILFSNLRFAKEIHCFVLRHGFDSDIFVVNALMTYYSRCDELRLARLLFDRMPVRDLVSWNSMIAGYSQGGYCEECKQMYKQMLGSVKLRPNGVTLVSVLQACGQTKDLLFGMEVHQYVNENQIEIDILLSNAFIGLYAKCGSLDYARKLFEDMSQKDGVTYGSLISGYMTHGFVDDAMNLFLKMENPALSTWNAVISGLVQNNWHKEVLDLFREMQVCRFRPNTVTLSSVLPTISYFANLKGGKEIHCFSIRRNYDQNIYISTALIDAYAKSGYLHGARRVFSQSKGKSLIIWTAIISAYAAHGDSDTSLGLFNEMLRNGIQPDPVTFTSVLAACAHSGVVDEAWNIFNSMSPEYGIQPSIEHYACMVGVLSRAGKLSEAAEFIFKMPIAPSAKVWGALLHGASISGDVELGKFVCDHLFEMEPENIGSYIIMANLYAQAGRWDEADKVRERLKKIGLKKVAGSSWIETSSGLQSFTATVVSDGRSEEICSILVKEEGYVVQDELHEESVYSSQ